MSNFLSGLYGYSITALFGAAVFLGQTGGNGAEPAISGSRTLSGPLTELVSAGGVDVPDAPLSPRDAELRAAEARFVARVAEDVRMAVAIVPAVALRDDSPAPAPAALVAAAGLPQARVTAEAVNLRSGPSKDFAPVGKAVLDEVVSLTGSAEGDWVEIEIPDAGLTAWVHSRYLDRL
jgi:hypothetical protein